MSKYPVTYHSGSKGESLNIEDMATPHLANAWRSVMGRGELALTLRAELVRCMGDELRARGCTLDTETQKWTFPPKAEVAS